MSVPLVFLNLRVVSGYSSCNKVFPNTTVRMRTGWTETLPQVDVLTRSWPMVSALQSRAMEVLGPTPGELDQRVPGKQGPHGDKVVPEAGQGTWRVQPEVSLQPPH